jgi:hypothetical protein
MTWLAAAVIGSAAIGAIASTSAAGKQAGAAQHATDVQQAMFNQTQANVAPWLTAGQTSLKELIAGTQPGGPLTQLPYQPFTLDKFHQDPGYQFQQQQGENAAINAMSKSGGPNSNNLKGLIGFSQGLANTDYQQALNNYITQFGLTNQTRQQQFQNLNTISAEGLGAGLQQGQISANVGSNIGQNIIGAGNAQASGIVGASNAFTGGISNAYNAWIQQQFLAKMNPGGFPGATPGTVPFDPVNAAG